VTPGKAAMLPVQVYEKKLLDHVNIRNLVTRQQRCHPKERDKMKKYSFDGFRGKDTF
jgi:hypothetical protein